MRMLGENLHRLLLLGRTLHRRVLGVGAGLQLPELVLTG